MVEFERRGYVQASARSNYSITARIRMDEGRREIYASARGAWRANGCNGHRLPRGANDHLFPRSESVNVTHFDIGCACGHIRKQPRAARLCANARDGDGVDPVPD